METKNNSYPWYALRVRSRHEDIAVTHMHARGYESFLPKYNCKRRWSDRVKEGELPLFPGYVFCKFDPLNRFPVVSIPGVVHVVGIGKMPVPVEESEIEGIKTAVQVTDLARDQRVESALLFNFPEVNAIVCIGGNNTAWNAPRVERVIAASPQLVEELRGPLRIESMTVVGVANQQGASRLRAVVY